jgi:hypothetical protein
MSLRQRLSGPGRISLSPWVSSPIAAFRSRATAPRPLASTEECSDSRWPLLRLPPQPWDHQENLGLPRLLLSTESNGEDQGKCTAQDAGNGGSLQRVRLRLLFRWHVYVVREELPIPGTWTCHRAKSRLRGRGLARIPVPVTMAGHRGCFPTPAA